MYIDIDIVGTLHEPPRPRVLRGLCFAELATRLPVSGSAYLYVSLGFGLRVWVFVWLRNLGFRA